jgi:hypothetical protein
MLDYEGVEIPTTMERIITEAYLLYHNEEHIYPKPRFLGGDMFLDLLEDCLDIPYNDSDPVSSLKLIHKKCTEALRRSAMCGEGDEPSVEYGRWMSGEGTRPRKLKGLLYDYD